MDKMFVNINDVFNNKQYRKNIGNAFKLFRQIKTSQKLYEWGKILNTTSSYLVCADDVHNLKLLPTLSEVCIRGTAVSIDGIYDQYRWGVGVVGV